MTRDLRSAEISVGKAREVLSDVRRQRAEHAARRAALESEQHDREAELDRNRDALAGQLRAAYLIGRQEPLKLLLNQEDPARAGRMFIYYGYFGRARAGQIKLIEDDVQRIAQLESEARRRGPAAGAARDAAARAAERARTLRAISARRRSRGSRPSRTRARRTSSGCAPSRPDSRSCCVSCGPPSSAIRSRRTMPSRACAASSRGR